jgi:DNA helicase IV
LGYQVRNTYAERDGQRMDITTFHSLAKRVICAHQPEWWSGQNTDSDDFWELEVPIKLDETLTATVPEYDLIVIDEAQDFLDLWIETVLRLLKPSGSVVVLMDSKQNIFNRANSLSQNSWTKFTLSTVIRQTKKLTEFVSLETKVDFRPHRLCPEGIEVLDLRTLRSDEEKQDALVSSGMLTSKSVILYVPDIELGPLNVQKLGRYQLIKQRDARANRGAIPLVSLNLFKGLEAEVVIISNYDAMNAEQQYVALTRAKSAVVLL